MTDAPVPQRPRWYYSVWFVLVMLFLVLGPLALPLLWKSDRFPRWSKWCLTLLMGAFLWWLTVQTINIVRATLSQLDPAAL